MAITVDELVGLSRQLSTRDRLRLIEQVARDMEAMAGPGASDQTQPHGAPQPQLPYNLADLNGMWKGIRFSDEEIEEARREIWRNFPREDI